MLDIGGAMKYDRGKSNLSQCRGNGTVVGPGNGENGGREMEIKRMHQAFSVCQVEDYGLVDFNAEFCFLGKTDEEKSLVCLTGDVPEKTLRRDDGWRAFRVQGVLDFSLIGILANIAMVLAERGISIFAVSTYNTDYVLMKEECYEKGMEALQAAGYQIVE